MFIKVADGNYLAVRLVDSFTVAGPDPSGNWLVRANAPGVVELGAFPTQADAETAILGLVANLGYSEV